MNEIFPNLESVSLSAAPSGSVVKIPRFRRDGYIVLITDAPADKGSRSVVFLNADFADRPPVVFMDNYRDMDACLSYKSKVHFEVSMETKDIDATGRDWFEVTGVIVLIGDQFYIRAAPYSAFGYPYQYVNVQTGALFSQQMPNDVWTFGSWKIWIRDPIRDREFSIFSFNIDRKS
jgi:hypothetical protein